MAPLALASSAAEYTSPAIPAASPVALDEQLVDGIASVTLALKLVQPLKDRYDWSGVGAAPVVTELTRITCGSDEGQLLCCAASSAADAITVTPCSYA